jgi:hypothetical protein
MKKLQKNDRIRQWEAPTLRYKGTVGEILKGGGGKSSTSPYDPGESMCPPSFCLATYD